MKKGRGNMKVTSISRKAFERLDKMKLSKNIRNTEAIIYNYTPKQSPSPKVFKKLHYQNGAVFGNKLFTIEMLDSNKEFLPPYFCIPDSIVTVGGVVQGITLPKIEGKNLADILKDKAIPVEDQIFYLKKVGQMLQQLEKIRENTDLTDIYINDLHESNFIVNEKNHELYVVDLDSCKIKDNQPAPSKYLTSKTLVNSVQGKYKFADPDCPTYGYVIADENSDLFCYTMMFLNYIYGDNAINLDLESYYDYLEYLRELGYKEELINALQSIVIPQKNENISQYLDDLTPEQIYRAREPVYKCVKKKGHK